MRLQNRSPRLAGLVIGLAGLTLFVGQATADIVIDRGGSAIIFPKVIADGTRDTLITLSNTSNMPAMAHCAYVQGAGVCERSDPVELCQSDSDCEIIEGLDNRCVQTWDKTDFDIFLTTKQPTMWRVSTGRVFDPTYQFDREVDAEERATCTTDDQGRLVCPGFFFTSADEAAGGFRKGNVPTPPGGNRFQGELKCVQVSEDGSLVPGNWLKGTATIQTQGSNQISTYNSINILGEAEGVDPFVMRLNNGEYNACPEAIEMTHFASDATNFVAEGLGAPCIDGVTDGMGNCRVRTEVTFIPCSQDLVRSIRPDPERVVVQMRIFDEFETRVSAAEPITCWETLDLTAWSGGSQWQGSTIKKTQAWTSQNTVCRAGDEETLGFPCDVDDDCGGSGVCAPQSGILAVVEQFYSIGAGTPGTAATNVHMVNFDDDADISRTGRCRGDLATTCNGNDDCGDGLCRLDSTKTCSNDAACNTIPDDFCDRCMNDEIFLAQPNF